MAKMATYTPPTPQAWSRLVDLSEKQASLHPISGLADANLTSDQAQQWLAETDGLAVAVNVPFCKDICTFCNCNVVVTRQYGLASQYVEVLRREITWFGQALRTAKSHPGPLEKLYIGGGTPSFLQPDDLQKLTNSLFEQFGRSRASSRDYCIECDPRYFSNESAEHIQQLGFNRVHFGVEDFNADVQQAVNRKYTLDRIHQAVASARAQGLKVSVDLVFGLPKQTEATLNATLHQLAKMALSRVYLQPMNYRPDLHSAQQDLNLADLPSQDQRLALHSLAVNFWQQQGYQPLGCNAFIHSDDPLSGKALTGHVSSWHRTHSEDNFNTELGFGLGMGSQTEQARWRNHSRLRDYIIQVNKQGQGVNRCLVFNLDDQIRRFVSRCLTDNKPLQKADFRARWGCDFDQYFAEELSALAELTQDHLFNNSEHSFELTTTGSWFAENIARLFDYNGEL